METMNEPEYEDGPWAKGWEVRCDSPSAAIERIEYLEDKIEKNKQLSDEIVRLVGKIKHEHINFTAKISLRKQAEEGRLEDCDKILKLLGTI